MHMSALAMLKSGSQAIQLPHHAVINEEFVTGEHLSPAVLKSFFTRMWAENNPAPPPSSLENSSHLASHLTRPISRPESTSPHCTLPMRSLLKMKFHKVVALQSIASCTSSSYQSGKRKGWNRNTDRKRSAVRSTLSGVYNTTRQLFFSII